MDDIDIISVSVSAPLFTYPDFLVPIPPPSDIFATPEDEWAIGDVDF